MRLVAETFSIQIERRVDSTLGIQTAHTLTHAAHVVRELYLYLLAIPDARVEARYSAWLVHFAFVHGPLERKKAVDRHKLAETYGVDEASLDLPHLMFAVETAFAFLMKSLAFLTWSEIKQGGCETFEHDPRTAVSDEQLIQILRGEITPDNVILNYSHTDTFDWPALATDQPQWQAVRGEFIRLAQSRPKLSVLIERDELRTLYQTLVPRAVRHAIGAFYTPDWLADYVVEQVLGHDETLSLGAVTDPTCGSGAFLVAVLRRLLASVEAGKISASAAIERVQKRIVGYDVNPIAVLAARTNVLFFVCALLKRGGELPREGIHLPVFLCDSVFPPAPQFARSETQLMLVSNETEEVVVRVGGECLSVPVVLLTPDRWQHEVMAASRVAQRLDSFQSRGADDTLIAFLRAYEARGLLAFGQSLLLDAVAPVFHTPSAYVVGNPPWVNWEYLPPDYREAIKHLWPQLGLFDLTGRDLANSKEDISVLITYVACDRYLRVGGQLGFILPQSVFKSPLNARGFRRFKLGQNGAPLQVVAVDDLVDVQPFEGVKNRSAVLLLRKGVPTTYPVPYRQWKRRTGTKWNHSAVYWSDVASQVTITQEAARPLNDEVTSSHWITGTSGALEILSRLSGKCPYRARTGVFTGGANGVYYLRHLATLANGNLLVRNFTERAKRKVEEIEAEIEPTFVHPLLRGRDVDRWAYSSSLLTLCPHTAISKMRPVPIGELAETSPLTLKYFEHFRAALDERRGFVGWERQYLEQGFYAIQRVGDYTFAPYKVIWRYIASDFRCAVVEPGAHATGLNGLALPHEKLMLIPFHSLEEAYYVGGLLNSSPVRYYVESHMVSTQIAPHVISTLGLPRYAASNQNHTMLSQAAHGAQHNASDLSYDKFAAQELIDEAAAAVLGLSPSDLVGLQRRRTAVS